jgi:hypothetical protein
MRCLSLWQPWATLLAAGLKRVETRSWALKHGGPLLVHAARHWSPGLDALSRREPFLSALKKLGVTWKNPPPSSRGARAARPCIPFGAVVGRVNVVACVPTSSLGTHGLGDADPVYWPGHPKYFPLQVGETERAFGDYSPGRFAFLCEDAVLSPVPVPFCGRQGLFEVPDHLIPETS